MQHVSSASFVPANAADRRDHALRLYAGAVAAPAGADWQSVAHALRAALPASRGKAKPAADAWADYAPGRKCVFQSVAVSFADGRAFNVTAASNPGAPLNLGRAIRAAVAFYRSKVFAAIGAPRPTPFESTLTAWDAAINVPPFASVELIETGESFDPVEASRLTAAIRAGAFTFAPFALSGADIEAARVACPYARPESLASIALRLLYVAAWERCYLAAEVAHREAHAARLAAHEAREAIARTERDTAAGPERCERWADMMAAALPDMPEAELSGTFEAEAEPCAAPEPVAAIPAPAPVEAIPAPVPVEEIAPVEAVEAIAEPDRAPDSDDAWEPSAATHPFVVLCNSRAAFEKLCAVILDGTFPAAGHVAKGGAWRLSVEDAAAVRRIARTVVLYAPEA